MKLLTLNTHSIIEDNYHNKTEMFIDAISRIRPDIIAMQEVNQTMTEPVIALGDEFDVRRDNHAYRVVKGLCELGLDYSCLWRGIKTGYDRYDEGIAILSRLPISETRTFRISHTTDKSDWRCRRVVGAKINGEWFYSVHLGWYDDKEDPFSMQWQTLNQNLSDFDSIWLMGDFNCVALSHGYNEVVTSGWYDAYDMADERDSGVTVRGRIDGWRDKNVGDMRLDYIFTNRRNHIKSIKVIFNGVNEDVVSDHYGVLAEI